VFHDGWGLGAHAIERARMLAQLGYVALAADMYGRGRELTDFADVRAIIGDLRSNPTRLRCRADAAISVLRARPEVDPSRLAAIGFCFGGLVALELARAGSPLRGVVSFHGALESAAPAQPGVVEAKLLVCTGADDPMVPVSQVIGFEDEMRKAGADWQVIAYGGTVHSFTDPDAGRRRSQAGVAYNAQSDRRSWAAMRNFFEEIFYDR